MIPQSRRPSFFAVRPSTAVGGAALMTGAAVLALALVSPASAAEDDLTISLNSDNVVAVVEGATVTFEWDVSDATASHKVTGNLLNVSDIMTIQASKSGQLDVTAPSSANWYATVGAYDAADSVLDQDRVRALVAPRVQAVSNACGTITFSSNPSDFSGLVSNISYTDASGAFQTEALPASSTGTESATVTVAPGTVHWGSAVRFADVDQPAEQGGSVDVAPCVSVPVDPGTNVVATSDACGEVTFTGVNSDSTITVVAGGETFDVGYEELVTIKTDQTSLNFRATTQWTNGNWAEEGSVDIEACAVPSQPVNAGDEDHTTPAHPVVAPAAGL